MTFKTQDQLVAFSTGVFIDNTSGLIVPSNFRSMHEHFADSMIPYDASGPLLWIYTGGGTTGWGSISITPM